MSSHNILCILILLIQLTEPVMAQRVRINMDEDWKFHLGHAADPSKDFNYGITAIFAKSGKTDHTALAINFNDSDWRKLNLPHDWAVELPFVNSPNFDVMAHGYKPVGGLFPGTSIGWYRKHFTISRADSGLRFQVQFDGVFRDAEFWLNGFYLGNNKSGYIGAVYDITDYINYEKNNVLVVRVDATQYEGWFYEGAGIYRHVWLNKFPATHILNDGVFIHSKMKRNKAIVTVEVDMENSSYSSSESTIVSYITNRNGRKIVQSVPKPVRLNSKQQEKIIHQLSITNPVLWNLESPYLYRVTTIVKQKGKVIDSITHRFGIRTIDIKPDGVYLNGKYIKLKGTNNHQDHAGVGSALPDYLQYYRIRLLKDMGSNAYRASHNPPTPELLDACDSLGMLVMDEQRLLNSSPEYVDQFRRLILRDRNHPSVFMWSIGNEEGWVQANSTGKRIAESLLSVQKQLDPTRLSIYAADLPNVFHGINEVIPVRGFNYRQFAVADYHRDHPQQPIIGTEMGSTVTTRGIYELDSVIGYVPDQDITAPWWASTAETWWTLAAENRFWLGGFIWTGFDYRGEPTPFKWPNINSHFGVMDMCGFPKNIYYYYKSWWSNEDVLHISPHWNWKGNEGKEIEVWINSNAEQVELFLNGQSLGKKDMPLNRHLKWKVKYEAGKLEAVGVKKGKKIIEVVETTGEAIEIVMEPDKKILLADGKDAIVINLSVKDKEGRSVPDANHLLHFNLSGDAKIIGVGNGDPSSHEPDKYLNGQWKRSLFNGKCQVILQAGKSEGKVVLEAWGENLTKQTIMINSISN